MANSFASLSAALSWGAIILAVIAIVAAIAWGRIVTVVAEKEAREEAKKCAELYIREWLSREAPVIVRKHIEIILDSTLGPGDDLDAADEIGEQAG